MNINLLSLFLHIVEKGSLAAAARALNLSATTVSDRLSALEAHYGVTLLNRTTRAISLTEEGRTLVDGARQLLSEAEELDSRIRHGAETLSGSIRISAAIDLGHSIIEPIVNDFLNLNPKVSIEILLTDQYVNIVDQGIDIAIRFGDPIDSTLRAQKLGKNSRVICASPTYIARYGEPTTPDELAQHNCLLMRFGQQLDNIWHLQKNGENLAFSVNGNRIANDGRLVHRWCLAGFGIALKTQWDVQDDIKEGRLIHLLKEYTPPTSEIYMLFPPSRTKSRRVRDFSQKIMDTFHRNK
jgi:DNA-binding transcriptional LysR family regulator